MKITENIFSFLIQLRENNNRDWFHDNKKLYETAKKEFEVFVNLLIPKIREIDQELPPIEAKDCIFRIFRDTRFSKDKTPYKTNFGAYITNGGRKSMFPGYYVHIEPDNSFVAGGAHMPPSDVLKAIRTSIFEHPDEFKAIITKESFVAAFKQLMGDKLKSAPRGFNKDFEDIELIKYKEYTVWSRLENDTVLSKQFSDSIISLCLEMKPFLKFLRDAIGFMEE